MSLADGGVGLQFPRSLIFCLRAQFKNAIARTETVLQIALKCQVDRAFFKGGE